MASLRVARHCSDQPFGPAKVFFFFGSMMSWGRIEMTNFIHIGCLWATCRQCQHPKVYLDVYVQYKSVPKLSLLEMIKNTHTLDY